MSYARAVVYVFYIEYTVYNNTNLSATLFSGDETEESSYPVHVYMYTICMKMMPSYIPLIHLAVVYGYELSFYIDLNAISFIVQYYTDGFLHFLFFQESYKQIWYLPVFLRILFRVLLVVEMVYQPLSISTLLSCSYLLFMWFCWENQEVV